MFYSCGLELPADMLIGFTLSRLLALACLLSAERAGPMKTGLHDGLVHVTQLWVMVLALPCSHSHTGRYGFNRLGAGTTPMGLSTSPGFYLLGCFNGVRLRAARATPRRVYGPELKPR